MLRGIDANPIIVGAYVDRDGGVCPMLAAHRNGGRTSLASFARAWDRYTGAKRPRLATRRELRTLRSLLEASLLPATDAARLDRRGGRPDPRRARRDRRARGARAAERAARRRTDRCDAPTPASAPAHELRDRLHWSWMRPARRYEEYRDLLAAAEEQLAEQRSAALSRPAARRAA